MQTSRPTLGDVSKGVLEDLSLFTKRSRVLDDGEGPSLSAEFCMTHDDEYIMLVTYDRVTYVLYPRILTYGTLPAVKPLRIWDLENRISSSCDGAQEGLTSDRKGALAAVSDSLRCTGST